MDNRYNFFYFEAEFKKYLVAGKAESSTIKNYLSDLHYFFSWVQNTRQISQLAYSEVPEVFSHSLIHSYYEYLESSTKADNTVIRRFATLRKFFLLCLEQRWISVNPVDEFDKRTKQDEKEEVIHEYRKSLEQKQLPVPELERHISIIRDLVINSNQL